MIAPPAAPARIPARHRLRAALLALAGVIAGGAGTVAWHYADRILGPDVPPTFIEQRVVAAGPGWIRLSRDAESAAAGTWALEWPAGSGWLGPVLAQDSLVTRAFTPLVGRPPVGGWASVRGIPRAATPAVFGLPFREVAIRGPLGTYPAWFVPGRGLTWAVFVHGRGATRAEGLRTYGAVAPLGMPGLFVTYRNDAGAPRSPDGRYRLGLTEWRDVEAAVAWALAHGARDVVLCGYSMGGQVVMQFLAHSSTAPRVRAAVLESPVLDWTRLFALRAHEMGLPPIVTWLGLRCTTLRTGIDWRQLDRATNPGDVRTPILVFHATTDRWAPYACSAEFARHLPGRVTLVTMTSGNHVNAWNIDRAAYARTVTAWLTTHGIGPERERHNETSPAIAPRAGGPGRTSK